MRIDELELPKSKWVLLISTADKREVSGDLIDLVQQAYQNTTLGSFINTVGDLLPSDWEVMDWDKDPDVDVAIFFRKNRAGESWTGNKIQGLGHDGTSTSKSKAIQMIIDLLGKPGYWVEASDVMRSILLKSSASIVSDETVLKQLFSTNNLKMISETTYKRKLNDGTVIVESVFGNPVLR